MDNVHLTWRSSCSIWQNIQFQRNHHKEIYSILENVTHHQFVLSVERYRKSRFGGIFYRAAVRVPEEGAGQPGGHGILGWVAEEWTLPSRALVPVLSLLLAHSRPSHLFPSPTSYRKEAPFLRASGAWPREASPLRNAAWQRSSQDQMSRGSWVPPGCHSSGEKAIPFIGGDYLLFTWVQHDNGDLKTPSWWHSSLPDWETVLEDAIFLEVLQMKDKILQNMLPCFATKSSLHNQT